MKSESEFIRIPGGFGGMPSGKTVVGQIPAKPGYSDGTGVAVTVQPGQVELLFFPTLIVGDKLLLIRASFQSTAAGASIALAAIDGFQDGSIATNIPANSSVYLNDYKRNSIIYDPPTDSVAPIIQVSNVDNTVPVTVYIDTLEVFLLPRDKYRRFYGE